MMRYCTNDEVLHQMRYCTNDGGTAWRIDIKGITHVCVHVWRPPHHHGDPPGARIFGMGASLRETPIMGMRLHRVRTLTQADLVHACHWNRAA